MLLSSKIGANNMNTIVKKLNEKAVELGADGNAKTVVEALNQITEATGGTPSTTNKITDAIEQIQFGEGGEGSGEISDENCITVRVVNNWASIISLQWCNGRTLNGYFESIDVNGYYDAEHVLKASNGKYVFCAYAISTNIIPSGKSISVSSNGEGFEYYLSNSGSTNLSVLVYYEFEQDTEEPTVTFSLVD